MVVSPFGTETIKVFAFRNKPAGYDALISKAAGQTIEPGELLPLVETDGPGRAQTLQVTFTIGLNIATPQVSWQDRVRDGRAAFSDRRFDESIAAYDQALAALPANDLRSLALIHSLRARALEGRGDVLQAEQSVKAALYYQPDDAAFTAYLRNLEQAAAAQVPAATDLVRSLEAAKGFSQPLNPPSDGPLSVGVVDLQIKFEVDQDRLDADRESAGGLSGSRRCRIRALAGETGIPGGSYGPHGNCRA